MEISKESFQAYEKVRESGVTNMMDIKTVCLFANISKEECINIMDNYDKYKKELI